MCFEFFTGARAVFRASLVSEYSREDDDDLLDDSHRSCSRTAEVESLKATVNAECEECILNDFSRRSVDRHASRGRSPHVCLAAAPWLGAQGCGNTRGGRETDARPCTTPAC